MYKFQILESVKSRDKFFNSYKFKTKISGLFELTSPLPRDTFLD